MSGKYVLARHVRIYRISLLDQSRARFSVRVGSGSQTAYDLEIAGEALTALPRAATPISVRDIVDGIRADFPEFAEDAAVEAVNQLIGANILVPAWERGGRYLRHHDYYAMLGEQPIAAQERLAQSHVALVGVGGIGTWVSYLLSAAGVGRLTLVDDDSIEVSNLTRQVLFGTRDIGRSKLDVAAARLLDVNPATSIRTIASRVHTELDVRAILAQIGEIDFLLLSADTPTDIVYWFNRVCNALRLPWSYAGYTESLGMVGPLVVPGATACFECNRTRQEVELLPLVSEINDHYKAPSFGPLNGAVSALQAKEAIHFLLGRLDSVATLEARLFLDILTLETTAFKWQKDEACHVCGGGVGA